MRKTSLALAATVIGITGCASTGGKKTSTPPPFECTSIHPEVCDIEREFHKLRHEQAEQNAAIDAAERRRKASVTASVQDPGEKESDPFSR